MENQFKNKNFFKAFGKAVDGIIYNIISQRNAKIQIIIAILVIALGVFLQLEIMELIVVIICISLVFVTETVNTAIETTVDLVTEEYNTKAKIAKDVASGAVLIAAINAVIVGCMIFTEKIIINFF